MRKLRNPDDESDDEEDQPLPMGFRRYQVVWATDLRHGTKPYEAILLGTLYSGTVVVQWEGSHRVGESTECHQGTVGLIEFDNLRHRVSENNSLASSNQNPLPERHVPPPPTRPPPVAGDAIAVMTPDASSDTQVIIKQDLSRAPTENVYERARFARAETGLSRAWILSIGESQGYVGDALILGLGGSVEQSIRSTYGPEFEIKLDNAIRK